MASVNNFVPGLPVEDRAGVHQLDVPAPLGSTTSAGAIRRASRWAVLGASREMRNYFSRSITGGNLRRVGGWIFGTTATDHNLHTGARCYIAMQPANSPNVIDSKFRGHFTFIRTGANTFKGWMPRSDDGVEYPDGITTRDAELLAIDMAAPSSVIGWLNYSPLIKGSINIVCASAIGGTNTAECRERFKEVLAFKPDGIFLNAGVGNDRVGGLTEQQSNDNLQWMVDECKARGIIIVQSPGSVPDNTYLQANLVVGNRVAARQMRRSRASANHYILDEITPAIDPATGYSKPLYLADAVHQSAEGAMQIANYNAAALAPVIPVRDPLIKSVLDRYAADPAHPNIYDGGWSGSGLSASGQDSKCTGTVDNAVLVSTAGNASRAMACSLVSDGNGAFINRYVMTGVAANDSFTIDYRGNNGARMKDRLKSDTEYEVAAKVNFTVSGANVVGGWAFGATASMDYEGVSGASGALGAALTYQGDFAKAGPTKYMVVTSPGQGIMVFRFRTPKGLNNVSAFNVSFNVVFAAAGTATLDVSYLSCSEVLA